MNQVSVKWVESGFLLDDAAKLRYAGVRQRGMIPVIELSALRTVVEGLKQKEGTRKCVTADQLNMALGHRYALDDLLALLGEGNT